MAEIGETYETGDRIGGRHCPGCLESHLVLVSYAGHQTTLCCGRVPCYGAVGVDPWVDSRSGTRRYYACCRGVAERALGELCVLSNMGAPPC